MRKTLEEQRRTQNDFTDFLREKGADESVVETVVTDIVSGKWKHPFLIECAHHAVFLQEDGTVGQVDTEGESILDASGVHDSLKLWVLAARVRRATGRSVHLIISLSDLHLTKSSEERKRLLSLLWNESVKQGLLSWFPEIVSGFDPSDLEFSVIMQSEGTRLVRNRMERFLWMKAEDVLARAKKLFQETGRLVIHARMDDGIEAIYLSTPVTRARWGRLAWGVPLVSRMDDVSDWETQCGPTVAGIQARMYDVIGKSRPETHIFTFDDLLDPSIGLKSKRWVHIVNDIIGVSGSQGLRSILSSHGDKPVVYNPQHVRTQVTETFDTALEAEMQILAKHGFTEIGIYRTPLTRFRASDANVQGCEIWLCVMR